MRRIGERSLLSYLSSLIRTGREDGWLGSCHFVTVGEGILSILPKGRKGQGRRVDMCIFKLTF